MIGEPTLVTRIERIERQNRILRGGGLLLVVSLAGVLLCGQAIPEKPAVVQGRAFRLVDQGGKTRAELALAGEAPNLALLDAEGRVRVSLTVQPAGAKLVFYDEAAKARLMAALGKGGVPAVALYDGQARSRTTWALRDRGDPVLFFSDAQGKVVRMLP